MGERWKGQIGAFEEPWINVLQCATQAEQAETDSFLALLEVNGLKVIEVDKYNNVMAAVEESIKAIETLENLVGIQADEIAALEYRIKTLTTSN